MTVNTQGQIPAFPVELPAVPRSSPAPSRQSRRKQGARVGVPFPSLFHICATYCWCDWTDTKLDLALALNQPASASSWPFTLPSPQESLDAWYLGQQTFQALAG